MDLATALPLNRQSNDDKPRVQLARLPVAEHTRLIQQARAVFPGARVVAHEWRQSENA